MILVIDNYNSFTYNLVQYLGEMGAELDVRRNDQMTLAEVARMAPTQIVISPGPGTPDEAGITLDLIREFGPRTPIFGVCLGQQAIGQALGGKVIRAEKLMHGKTSPVYHDGAGVFAGLPSPFEATRYHSLIVERETLPDSPGNHGGHRRRRDHGPEAQDLAAGRRPVSPRVGADGTRQADTAELLE